MNFRNIIIWGLIVLLSVGLFNLFQNPNKAQSANNKIAFSKFLEEVDAGRVIQVEIQGNNINGIMSDNSKFNTYSPNYPDLVEKLSLCFQGTLIFWQIYSNLHKISIICYI